MVTRPAETIHADSLELTRTSSGNKYVLTLIDGFTKLVNLGPVQNQRAETITDVIFQQYMSEHGIIKQLHTD